MSISPVSKDHYMPSESTFKSQVALARAYLASFEAMAKLDSPIAVQSAIENLCNTTSEFHRFIPYFDTQPLFIDTVTSVFDALDPYFKKNPSVEMPASFKRVIGLNSTVRNLPAATRKCTSHSFYCYGFSFDNLSLVLPSFSSHHRGQSPRKETQGQSSDQRKSLIFLNFFEHN